MKRTSFSLPSSTTYDEITQQTLDSLNAEQSRNENKAFLEEIGGLESLSSGLGVSFDVGLSDDQVINLRRKFGPNAFPESPRKSFLELLIDALSDSTLLVLMAAAAVSLVIGILSHPETGYIEGTAIFIAVFLVAMITAFNDYTKELQFRALEASSQFDERASVLRNGNIERINPAELVVGDILVLQSGDMIPADCIMVSANQLTCNESSLTGEPEDLKKSLDKDCFLLSSCLITDGDQCRALVIGVGLNSQWGKIKSNLVTEAVNTPLQSKLEKMTRQIGYIGMGAAFGTFLALIISIWARKHGHGVLQGFIQAFIISVTVVVVAIPEGLPLAVTISLAYSTKKMYRDQCFIRVLAACETMGNATNICSDKTGTLTENRMTVVEGWFGDRFLDEDDFGKHTQLLHGDVKIVLAEHISVNRTAYFINSDEENCAGNSNGFGIGHGTANTAEPPKATCIGSKTEGAMLTMIMNWGFDPESLKVTIFDENHDKLFAFNSAKKRSTCVIHRSDGSVRIFCKGASEWLIKDCCLYMDKQGNCQAMTAAKMKELEKVITDMANRALRTLVLAHRDFSNVSQLPTNWSESPPDNSGYRSWKGTTLISLIGCCLGLCLDGIVGIIDPLRADVKDAVTSAQSAGVFVRMITGDNIATANAIARNAGILTDGGLSIEGPVFRMMTPKQVDEILPKLQVMARSSPEDKYLLVTRLNGYAIPENEQQWNEKHKDKLSHVSWANDRDNLLPGYVEEWEANRPEGGEVVGVTGDGTNDAPALKAADVGLAMGITGTKVAQSASDIVVLDDRFSSIVRAILWGRSVYDNIRKFLQFQLTVNIVALSIVFIGAVCGFGEPLNAVQMLWVNLVMDTFGALALGTEPPTPALLKRKPYKRSASLISRPMIRNIAVQAIFQLVVLLVLLFRGSELFDVPPTTACSVFSTTGSDLMWSAKTGQLISNLTSAAIGQDPVLTCSSFAKYCFDDNRNTACVNKIHQIALQNDFVNFRFGDLDRFESECLSCKRPDYTQGTIIFNTFIYCQVFNEFNSRQLFNDWNIFRGLEFKHMFTFVITISVGLQYLLVTFGSDFVKTVPLTAKQWMITVALGFLCIPVGFIGRFIPVDEDPNSFYYKEGDPVDELQRKQQAKELYKKQSWRSKQYQLRNKLNSKSKEPSVKALPIRDFDL